MVKEKLPTGSACNPFLISHEKELQVETSLVHPAVEVVVLQLGEGPHSTSPGVMGEH